MIPVPVAVSTPNMVTEADYPRDALMRGEEGVVAVRFQVDRDGFPELCRVEQSSGHPSLDRASCRVIIDHFNFKPKPNAVPPSVMTKRIRWQISDDQREQSRQALAPNGDAERTLGWLLFAVVGIYLVNSAARGPGSGAVGRAGARAAERLGVSGAGEVPVLVVALASIVAMIALLVF